MNSSANSSIIGCPATPNIGNSTTTKLSEQLHNAGPISVSQTPKVSVAPKPRANNHNLLSL